MLYNNNELEELKSHLEEYVNEITDKSKARNQYVCPICHSGYKKNHTGAFTVYPESNTYFCFACRQSGNIFSLYAEVNHIDIRTHFKDIVKQLATKYNTGYDISSYVPENATKIPKDYTRLFYVAQQHLHETNYLTNRGLSLATQQYFGCGYIADFKYNRNENLSTSAVIIPTSNNSFMWRSTVDNLKRKRGTVHILNPQALQQPYCFVVEGEIDCMSIFECGMNCIGLGSTSNTNKIFNYDTSQTTLILALDNDNAGLKATTELEKLCRQHRTAYIKAPPTIWNGCKDANELLIANKEKLIENLNEQISKALSFNREEYLHQLEEENIVPEKQEAEDNKPAWYKKLHVSRKGIILNGLDNIVTILQNDENFKEKILFNEFSNMREYKEEETQLWNDKLESKILLYFKTEYNISISIQTLIHACNNVEVKYNPVKQYLEECQKNWDYEHRLGTIFSDFLGAEKNQYNEAVAIISLCGAVARVFKPGIKFDTTTVLVGKQGIGKSKFINKIAVNPDWFTDSVTTFDGKEFYEGIQGKWIIELGEGTAFQKSIKERTKQAITSQQDYYREPYARHPEVRKRQCVFWATTNNYDFLKDETGDRRFYPIDCDISKAKLSIDNDLTKEYINQLWGEATAIYKDYNKIIIPTTEFLQEAERVQKEHLEKSTTRDDIETFLNIKLTSNYYSFSIEDRRKYIKNALKGECCGYLQREFVSVKEIMCEFYDYEVNQPIDRKISLEITRSLKALGWNPTNKSERQKYYGVIKPYTKN